MTVGIETSRDMAEFLIVGSEMIPPEGVIEPEIPLGEKEKPMAEMDGDWQKLYTYCRRLTLVLLSGVMGQTVRHPVQIIESNDSLWFTFDLLLCDNFGDQVWWAAPRRGFLLVPLPEREPHWIWVMDPILEGGEIDTLVL